jgi:hypothetical protein
MPVIALMPKSDPAIELSDGARVVLRDGGAEIRDPSDRLLVRYREGCAEITAPAGDLVLAAPTGRVVLRSAEGIAVDTGGDVAVRAENVALEPTQAVVVRGRVARLTADTVELVAERMVTKARTVAHKLERLELQAKSIVERADESFRFVADVAELRAGRVRTLVRELFAVRTRRGSLVADEDMAVDGRRVLLG